MAKYLKLLTFSFCFIFCSKSSAGFQVGSINPPEKPINPWECPGLHEDDSDYYKKQISRAQDRSKKRDVEKFITSIDASFQRDCEDSKYVAAMEKITERAIQRGWRSETELMSEEADKVSKYRQPTYELERLKVFYTKMGTSYTNKEPEFKKLMKRGLEASQARKNSCTSVDNRRPPLGNIVRSQDSIGWCYAYTAADLMSHKLGVTISAFDVANSYNNGNWRAWIQDKILRRKESEQQGGLIDDAIKEATKKGLCPEEDLRSSDFKFQEYATFLDELSGIESAYAALKSDRFQDNPSIATGLIGSISGIISEQPSNIEDLNVSCSNLQNGWTDIFSNLDLNDFTDVIAHAGDRDMLNQLIRRNCRGKRLNGEFDIKSKGVGILTRAKHLVEDIDDQLNSENIVGISYYASLLENPYGSKSGGHASSVVARRFNESSGSCEYLIRNSWGDGCNYYSSRYECENGQIWIPQEYLERMLFEITYINT